MKLLSSQPMGSGPGIEEQAARRSICANYTQNKGCSMILHVSEKRQGFVNFQGSDS